VWSDEVAEKIPMYHILEDTNHEKIVHHLEDILHQKTPIDPLLEDIGHRRMLLHHEKTNFLYSYLYHYAKKDIDY